MLGFEAAIAMALSAAAPGAAAPAPEDGAICVGGLRYWRGSGEDIGRIASVPVPAGYRTLYFEGDCGSGLVHESLIDWHFAFGNEASAVAALAFFDGDYLAHYPAPDALPPALAEAWREARPDLRAAEPLLDRGGPDYDRARRQLGASPRVSRLNILIRAHGRLSFLADQYMRVAEFYGSGPLLARARSYFDAAESGMTTLYRGTPQPAGGPGASVYNYLDLEEVRTDELHDIEMRLAITRARLSRSTADIDAAAGVVEANYSPVLRIAAENADRQGDFCDNGQGDGLDTVRAACRGEINFPGRFVRFWRHQAVLDMLMAADPDHCAARPDGPPSGSSGSSFVRRDGGRAAGQDRPVLDSFDHAVAILERGRLAMLASGSRHAGSEDDLATLYLARADMYARLAARARDRSGEGSSGDAAEFLSAALDDLTRAERLSPPTERPGRFRQIAALYLPLAERLGLDRRQDSDGRSDEDPAHAREAAYLREMLPHLDRISASEFPRR